MVFNATFNNISVRLNVHPSYEYTFGKIITIMCISRVISTLYCALFVDYKCMYLGLWYLTPLSTMVQLYRGGQFY